MLRKRILLITILCSFITAGAWAQVYTMGNTTVNTCGGTFYDSGGNAGNYGNNQNYTMTFCSSVPGNCIRLMFTSFNIETNFDEMTLYDGPNTASPVIGTYTGNTSPGLITANSGCLTVVFTSDGVFNDIGWAATISCVNCPTANCATTCNGGPAPVNDACTGATNLGPLPAPSACPGGIGALTITNSTNLCATAETPYTSLLGCQPSGNMASPAADVWYRFSITGPSININISGGINTPNIGLYEGFSCAGLIPRGCAIGSNGSLNTTFGGLAAGTYYLQVSGGNLSDQCDFTLTLQNNYDCEGCVIQSTLVANPPPVNGSYPAGQVVTFCYTISDYNQTSANWLHGVVPDFGAGWDMSTFNPAPVADCSGQGNWSWYAGNITSSATGNVTGPGFYFESPLGNPFGISDGNPGNNFGDNNSTNNCDWTFCWTISTLPPSACVQGTSLNININTLGDGESGSWGSLACTQDPVTNFFATLSCCEAPAVNVTSPLCQGVTNGSASAQGMGDSPWDYVWSDASGTVLLTQNNIAGSSSINNLAPGTYTVSVTDNTGCTATSAFVVATPPSFSAVMNTTDLSCNGNMSGAAQVIVNGGTPGYTYSWSPAGTGSNPTNLAAGNYTVTVTDGSGCTTTVTATIAEPALINANISSKTNVTCNGGQDGAVTVSTTGGTAPYSYSWSNGAAGASISGLSAGAYTVTVTDNHGCTGFMTVAITEPTAIVLSFSSAPSSCGNANGSATVNAIGGTPGYTYQWSPSGGSSATASNLVAGGYNVTVTDSRGCTAIGNAIVTNSSGPTASITTSSDVSCFGGNDGSATVSVSGGTAPLSYSWSPAGGNTVNAQNLTAGNYTVTVTDGSGCTSSAAVIITEPVQLVINITANTPVSCSNENDGSLTAQANGGVPPYSYLWSGGSVNATDHNLLPGTYTVTVTDANGCTATTSATVGAPPVLQVSPVNTAAASCNGTADGSATVQAAGGTPVYTYVWSNGTAGNAASGLAAGTYTVTATDANGCTSVTNVVITAPSPLVLNMSSTGTTCGSTNGTASVVVNGGTGPYTYNWNPNGGNASVATNLPSGNFSVVVTDANGCIAIGNASVPSADGPILTLDNSVMVTCPGGTDGSIDISVNGGTLPYTYTWSNGAPGTQISNLAAGIYTLTVTDDNNCSAALSVNITQPAAFSFTMTPVDAHCGQADGSISAQVTGGTAPYSWQWSGSASVTNQLNAAVAGSYTVTVTDANGCTSATQATIADEPAPVLSLNNLQDASCAGAADGRIRVNIAGGTPPFTYIWSNGVTGNFNNNISAGTYTVTVTDDFGCTATFQATVNEPAPLVLATSSTSATCGSSNGSAGVVVNGGTPNYQYTWIPSGGMGANANGLAAGAYTVVVTDNEGCTEQANVTVPSSNGPSVAVLLSTDVSCNGGSDGDLTIAVNGGQAPYNYQWSSGGSGTTGSNLSTGNYTVTVTDANNCTSTVTAVINEPAALVLVGNTITAHCGQPDGSAEVIINGGIPGYSYSWSTGTSVNSTISAMPAGSYTVTVTDANGCTAQTVLSIADAAGPSLNIASLTDASCSGGADGSIGVSTLNGTAPFSYVWSNGTTAAVNPNLAAGTYTVTVTDNSGCTSDLQVTVNEPPAIQLAFSTTIATCGNSNGSAEVTPAGGSSPYSYLWSNGIVNGLASGLSAGIYTVTVTDAGGCSASGNTIINSAGGPALAAGPVTDVSCNGFANGTAAVIVVSGNGPFTFDWLPYGGTTATATGLAPGNYKVSVTDINGCSTALNFDITEPDPLVVNNLTTPAFCNGGNTGTADIDAQGGTAPYTFDWNPGGILPANRINLQAGNYDVTVTDNKGCTAITTAIVGEPAALNGTMNPVDASCYGGSDGSVSIIANGGTAPYTFLWSGGSSGSQLASLASGTYTVTISDNNGCTQVESIAVGEAPAINLQLSVTDATCGNANGSAQVNGNGGTGILSYQWSTGASGNAISNLSAGAYTVVATDANGCTQTGTSAVADMGGPVVGLLSMSDALCNGSSDGTAEVSISSGNGPFNYQWLPAGGNAAQATGLNAGAYSVNVTDVNGCVSSMNVNIGEPSALTLQLSSVQATCGNANGSATVSVSGGSGAYQYAWSNGDINATANAVPAGNYDVTVSDANGCTATASIAVTQPSSLSLQSSSTAASCFNGTDGDAAVSVNGGSAPYTYLWSNGEITAQINNVAAATYTVTVTDLNGCSFIDMVNVSQAPAINLQTITTDATCGGSNGSAQVNANGGTGVLTYLWSGGQTTATLNGLSSGSYTITATDANGCTATAVANVSNLGGPQATVLNQTNAGCSGGNDGSAEISVSSGNGPFSYQWQPTGGNGTLANALSAGNYTVVITDINGCVGNVNIIISEPDPLNILLNPVSSTCGNSNGSISATTNGGTGNYQYAWSNGSTGSASIAGLPAGNYSLVVTDANGCTATTGANVSNAGGPQLAVNNVTPASCYGFADGSASIAVNSGNGPFSYSWNPAGGSNANAAGLGAGNYTVTVTDINGCTGQQSIIILEPAALSLQLSSSPTQCNAANGSAQVQASGGVGNYSYQWNMGATGSLAGGLHSGTYTVTVSDGNGCSASSPVIVGGLPGPAISNVNTTDAHCYGEANGSAQVQFNNGAAPYILSWSNGSSGNSINGLSAGNYTVTVTDNFGCSDARAFAIQEPSPLVLNATALNMVSCYGGNNGNAEAVVSGGIAPYTYAWSNGATGAQVGGLTAGSYSVSITDLNGCTSLQSTIISEPPALVSTQAALTMVSCFGGTNGAAAFSVTGGTAPYQYNWSNGSATPAVNGLSAGSYMLTITDNNGCNTSSGVTITQPAALAFNTPVVTHVLCFNGNNGEISVSNYGGVAPYSYQWSNGGTNNSLNNLVAGSYTVTVSDANACTHSRVVLVSQPDAISIQSTVNPIPCFGMSTAAITVITSGGVAPYVYAWNTGSVSNSISSLPTGIYSVSITDAHNCTFDTVYTITQPTALQASVVFPDTICIGQAAQLSATVSGGTPSYSYQWSTSDTSSSISVNPAFTSNYGLTVTDANGCDRVISTIPVPVYPALSLSISASEDSICEGESTVLTAYAGGGNGGPYTYTWNANPLPGNTFTSTPDSSFLYMVSVSDACTVTEPQAQQYVVVHPLPLVNFTPLKAEGCNPVTVQFVSTTQTTSGSVYSWDFGDNSQAAGGSVSHTYTQDGSYDVYLHVIDKYGCENALTQNNVVTVYPLPVAFFNSDPQEVSILHPIVQFINGSTGAISAHWDFGDGTANTYDWSPEHIFGDTGRYKVELIAISNEGCVDTFYNEIIVKGETTFYVPNGFTPNGDGDNESFTGYGIGVERADFFIYDRWGKLVFQSNSLEKGWNGRYQNNGDECPEGTYVYLFKIFNGLPAPQEYSGRVTLVR